MNHPTKSIPHKSISQKSSQDVFVLLTLTLTIYLSAAGRKLGICVAKLVMFLPGALPWTVSSSYSLCHAVNYMLANGSQANVKKVYKE